MTIENTIAGSTLLHQKLRRSKLQSFHVPRFRRTDAVCRACWSKLAATGIRMICYGIMSFSTTLRCKLLSLLISVLAAYNLPYLIAYVLWVTIDRMVAC